MAPLPKEAPDRIAGADNESEFSFLDHEDFRRRFADPKDPGRTFFFVENVHCASCLRRIEAVGEELDGVLGIRLDMSRHVAEVRSSPGTPLAPVAAKLKSLGYPPRPVAWGDLHGEKGTRGSKSLLVRIGVAGACAGNIMLLTTSLYAGAQNAAVAPFFEWLTFVLFLPVLLYSALPFYRNSWAALRNRRSSIDVPIAAAVIVGSAVGLYHLVRGTGDLYFDSLAVLVFLLLSSRYLLFRLQNHFLSPGHLRAFYETGRVRVLDTSTGCFEVRHIDSVAPGDVIQVRRGERVPADGTLSGREAQVNAAVLSGEVEPQRVLAGQPVFAGTQLTSDEARIAVTHTGSATRIGRLLIETERGVLSRTPLISLTDRVAQWFSASVLVLAFVFATIYSFVDVAEAINRALALVILACPCALALATPLTQSLALRKAAGQGCLVKNTDALERLSGVRAVFFDKTGTLTRGELMIESWWPNAPTLVEREIIYALERDSQHPIGRLLAAHVSEPSLGTVPPVEQWCETYGVGVEGVCCGDRYEIRSLKSSDMENIPDELAERSVTMVGLYKNGLLQSAIAVADHVRATSVDAVEDLTNRGIEAYMLTGDAERPAAAVAAALGLPRSHVVAGKSPEEKQAFVAGFPRALMVGDGVNDAVALANAYVGVAVQGSMEASFKAADIYLTRPGLAPLTRLMALARVTISIIKRNLWFSLAYNATFGTLALLGFVNPLVAAVLMPASSVTVVLASVIGNAAWRRFDRRYVDREESGDLAELVLSAPPLEARN